MKKLLTGLCVLTFICSTMCNSFAAHKITELEIQKDVLLDGGDLSPNTTFTFTMTPAEVTDHTFDNYLKVKPGVDLGENNTIQLTYNTSDTNLNKTASFDLSHLTFENEAAIYRYEVKETNNNQNALTYDSTVFVADVYVTNTGDIEYIIPKDQNTLNKTPILFSNTYATEELEISKTVKGMFADKNKDFTFRVTLDETNTLPANTVLNAKKTFNDGHNETVTITVGQENEFTLKHNETLLISNLPEGLTYSVNEDSTTGYTCEMTDSDQGVMSDDGASVSFVNTKIDPVETGIILNTAPYVVSIGIVSLGFVFIFVRKRKSEF